MWGTLHKRISGQEKHCLTAELMHSKWHGWSRNSRANRTAKIHVEALTMTFEKIIHVTCINLVGITCENLGTTTDCRFYDRSGENTQISQVSDNRKYRFKIHLK